VVDAETIAPALASAIAAFDSATVLAACGAAIVLPATGRNFADLHVLARA
jgi:hypothetical protein